MRAHAAVDKVVVLDAVAVDDRDEPIHLVVGRGHRRFPDLSLLLLAIAHQDVDVVVLALEAQAETDAEAEGEAHAQRAGRVLNARGLAEDGVPLEACALLAEGVEFLDGDVAELREGRVLHRRRVALAHDEAVAALPRRVG